MFLDTSMYLCCQIYLYEFRYNHSTFVDLPDCCRDKEKGLITQSSVAQYKIKREDCNPLFSFSVATKFTYLNYIMNFSKVNIRDLAEAKYEDTYLLTTFKLYHVFQITNSLWFFIRTCQNYCIKNTYRIKKGALIPMERIVINNEKFL